MDSFKKRVKDIMQNKGLKQSDLAKMTGITEATISRYCNGRRTPNIKVLVKIAKILNVSTDYLLGIKDDNGKWIPCSERLPQNGTDVIAQFTSGSVTELRYAGNGIFQGIYDYSTKVIIAWMPLPEPYREVTDEENLESRRLKNDGSDL